VNVKVQGLLNAAKYVEEAYGQPALRDVIRACSEPVRDRYTSALAIEWHPVDELVEFVELADRKLGHGDGRIAEEIGAAGARTHLKGSMARVAFYVSKPEFLLQRLAGLWRQFNDEGSMAIRGVSDTSALIEVRGVSRPQWLFCCTITGWAREIVNAFGGATPTAKHVECRARGAPRCVWDARWTGERNDGGTKRG
jgi:hypothetical protein